MSATFASLPSVQISRKCFRTHQAGGRALFAVITAGAIPDFSQRSCVGCRSSIVASMTSSPAPGAPVSSSASGQISSGAMIAIAPMGGFDTYLAAAIREKKTPVQLTIDPAQSAYLLVSSQYEWHGWFANSYAAATGSANWNRNGGSANYNAAAASRAGSTRGLEASLMLIDKQTGHILWAYEVHKSSHGSLLFGTLGMRGQQSIAEACAKHLKEYIEKGKG